MNLKRNKVAAIIVAAGDSRRMEGIDKMFAPIGGRPVLARVLDTFQKCSKIDQIIVVMSSKNIEQCRQLVKEEKWDKVTDIVVGGKKRQDSVAEGLKKFNGEWVVIHDGARPLVTVDLIERGLDAAKETGAAAAAVPVTDTIKFVKGSDIVRQTLPRENLRAVQTPQVFRQDIVQNTYKFTPGDFTDDAALVEKAGFKVKLYMGSYANIKITTPDDLAVAEVLL
ncbi:MAG: 2-C-methyl-D-erythritol 4-phosphate cytidylyltransferase [Chloroflexi bacterium RBG_13_52_12]|nr:MAG: 2-C-methyl-D-erythritol 4-phosphate cytidylyltransferase [Chloroflexi bacterium RBG_13_52_12]